MATVRFNEVDSGKYKISHSDIDAGYPFILRQIDQIKVVAPGDTILIQSFPTANRRFRVSLDDDIEIADVTFTPSDIDDLLNTVDGLFPDPDATGTPSEFNGDLDDIDTGTTNVHFTQTEKTKLIGIATAATANSADATLLARANHTGSQAASTVTEDATHRFATDAEKTTWNAKASQAAVDLKADLVGGKVPAGQLPSFVDDIEEYANLAAFPGTGEDGKQYYAIDTGFQYRWTGSTYAPINSGGVALGETNATAYRGDRGAIAYDHSQLTGNPHLTTPADITGFDAAASAAVGTINSGSGNTLAYYITAGKVLASLSITASRALVSSGAGLPLASPTTAVEIAFIAGLTSNAQTQFNGKAPLDSPTFTGVPAAPTAAAATNTTQVATTAHVFAERTNTATLTNKTINGSSNTLSNISADSTIDGTTNKAYTATEKTKLAGIASGATANTGDVTLAGSQTLTNKSISGSTNSLSNIPASAILTGDLEAFDPANYQPVDADLTAIAALSPSNDDFVQRKAGAWSNRTIAQVKTDLSLTGTNSGDHNEDYITVLNLLGSVIKYQSFGLNYSEVATTIVNAPGYTYFIPVYIKTAQSITGVKFLQTVQGAYTATNNSKVALYSYSAGTMTLVASCANDTTLFKGTAHAVKAVAFSSPYSAAAGIYFVGLLLNGTIDVTQPQIGGGWVYENTAAVTADLTNSAKLSCTTASTVTDLPASLAMSAAITNNNRIWVGLY